MGSTEHVTHEAIQSAYGRYTSHYFADTDSNGAGHAAAFECGHRNILSNNDVEKVSIRWPESGDFNDMLINGAQVFEWPLGRAA